MKLLLDTHIWIWTIVEPWRLTSEVNQSLSDPANQLWVSSVSIWELILLVEKKRIDLGIDLREWVAKSKRELQLIEAPMSWAVAQDLPFTPLDYRDPADRLLVATARVFDLTLVTADARLIRADGVRILANQ